MTYIATLAILSTVITGYFALIERDRRLAVEARFDELYWEIARLNAAMDENELVRQLDDATRERDRLRVSNSYHIREAALKEDEVARLERQNVYLLAHTQRRREAVAGTLLMRGMVRVERKALVVGAGEMP